MNINEWTKKLGQQHWYIHGNDKTICGKPLLGNNYATVISDRDKVPCEECLNMKMLEKLNSEIGGDNMTREDALSKAAEAAEKTMESEQKGKSTFRITMAEVIFMRRMLLNYAEVCDDSLIKGKLISFNNELTGRLNDIHLEVDLSK